MSISPTIETVVLPQHAAVRPRLAAEYIDVTEGTLSQWRHRGEGPPYAKLGRRVVYRIKDLDAYLEENLVGGERG